MSTSCSSSSSTGPDGQPQTRSYTEHISSDDQRGTTIHRRAEESGKAPIEETRTYPAGRQVADNSAGRIEDVSDEQKQRDEEYEERMEEEYAKREGGV